CPYDSLHVAARRAGLMHRTDDAVSAAGLMGPKQSIASNDDAEIAEAVLFVLYRRTCEGPNAHQFVVGREMRSARVALLGSGNKLPSSFGEEAMIRTGDELRAVFQPDPVRRLDVSPMSEHARLHI